MPTMTDRIHRWRNVCGSFKSRFALPWTHARRDRFVLSACVLVELDPLNVAAAQQAAQGADLHRVEVVLGDASLTSQYQGMVPADLVLACGIFGNITDEDIERTISHFSQLCGAGATLVWTRHRQPPDQVPQICDWLEERGFARHWLSEPDVGFGVGVHRFTGETEPLVVESRMFSFRKL